MQVVASDPSQQRAQKTNYLYILSHPIDETIFVAVIGAKYEVHVCMIGYGNRASSSTQQRELMRRRERE